MCVLKVERTSDKCSRCYDNILPVLPPINIRERYTQHFSRVRSHGTYVNPYAAHPAQLKCEIHIHHVISYIIQERVSSVPAVLVGRATHKHTSHHLSVSHIRHVKRRNSTYIYVPRTSALHYATHVRSVCVWSPTRCT